jgi:hypothetical protein
MHRPPWEGSLERTATARSCIRGQVEELPDVEAREELIGRRPGLAGPERRIGPRTVRREVAEERRYKPRHRRGRRGRSRGARRHHR